MTELTEKKAREILKKHNEDLCCCEPGILCAYYSAEQFIAGLESERKRAKKLVEVSKYLKDNFSCSHKNKKSCWICRLNEAIAEYGRSIGNKQM